MHYVDISSIKLLWRLFQNNPHKLTLVMTPEQDYDKNCRDAEMRKLMKKVSALSFDEKENVFNTGNITDNSRSTRLF